MVNYVFRSCCNAPNEAGDLETSVRAALREVRCQGAFQYEQADTTETSGADGGYVLMNIMAAAGWQYHHELVFSRHGITCAYFTAESGLGTC